MKNKMLFALFACCSIQLGYTQSAGFNQTYIVVNNTFYDLNAATTNPDFNGANLGSFCQGALSGLTFNGAEHNNYKCGSCNITSTQILYNIHLTTSPIGSFVSNNIPFASDFSNGCGGKDQRWSKTNYNTNLLAGLTAGNYTIEVYSEQSTSCSGTVYASNSGANYKATFTIKPLPTIASISGDTIVCVPASIQFSNTTASGSWRVSNAGVVGNISSGGLFTTNGNTGSSQIQYIVTGANNCVDTAKKTINIYNQPTAAAITGAASVCVGSAINLNNIFTGGNWSSIAGKATINSNGIVNGTSVGTATIKYTISAGSCAGSVTKNITVNPLPAIPGIGYATGTINPQRGAFGSFCVGRTFNVVGSPSGGLWSASGIASVTSVGAVTINAVGSGTLTYSITSAAGCITSKTITGSGAICASRGFSGEQIVSSGEFTMYPNPAKSFIRLNVESLVGAGSIVVTDLYGKQIKTQTLSMGTNTIDVSKLSKGMYFVSMITSEGKTTKKLIIND